MGRGRNRARETYLYETSDILPAAGLALVNHGCSYFPERGHSFLLPKDS